jgi:hypothetical protein
MELQPESDNQVAITPTQFIMHSIAAPWTNQRIYEFWRDSTNLESHFGGSYDGGLAQFIGTQTRADANAQANSRAVSIETASNLQHTDPWTDAQVATLIRLGVWLHQTHGIPLRICRSWTDPGFGYHRLFPEWSIGGTACPGDARVKQFHEVVFPGIVRAASGGPVPSSPPVVPPAPQKAVEVSVVEKSLLPGFDPVVTLFNCVSAPDSLSVGCDMGDIKVRVDVFTNSGGWRFLGVWDVYAAQNLAFTPDGLPADTRKIAVKRVPRQTGDTKDAVPAVATLKYKPVV